MKGRFACATSWSVRVFDNFQFIRNNIGEEGRKDGLESSTRPIFEASLDREGEKERGKRWNGRKAKKGRGKEKEISRSRRVRLTFSIGELFAHGRRYIRGSFYQGNRFNRWSLVS